MENIKLTLYSNKKYNAENLGEIQILESECNATTIDVSFPEEYEKYSKRVDFMDIKGVKWTISLYAPEDKRNEYGEDFDKLNFQFTIPNEVAKRGELEVQPIAYLADSNIVVPFRILYLTIEKSILYASPYTKKVPDLVVKAYEYANKAFETSEQANQNSEHAESLTSQAAESAINAENSAKAAELSSKNAENSAKNSETFSQQSKDSALKAEQSANEAQESALASEESAKKAEELSADANEKSTNAVNVSNSANEKSTKTLEIVENLTVSSEELDCEDDIGVEIETDSETKHKNIKFLIPAPKKGTSYRGKGVWSESVEYINDQYFIDTVSMHGCTYYCKKSNINQEPLASAESEFWGIIAMKGSDAGVTIVDNLSSKNSDFVLSANQGRVLKELMEKSLENAVKELLGNTPDERKTLGSLSEIIDKIIGNEVNICKSDGSVQLGEGNNTNPNTLQFATYQLLDNKGKIPVARLVDSIYPVGSIYMSVNSTSPASLFGGSWEQLKDRFLLGAGDTYALGAVGGEANHTLTIAEMPSHTHTQNSHNHTQDAHNHLISNQGCHGMHGNSNQRYSDGNTQSNGSAMYTQNAQPAIAGTVATNQNTGGGGAHNNMPPYLTVYMWKRTA